MLTIVVNNSKPCGGLLAKAQDQASQILDQKKLNPHMQQLIDIANVLFVYQEQDHMVANMDGGFVMGDQRFFIADD